eukprot:3967754-Amphidinium_carterae.1
MSAFARLRIRVLSRYSRPRCSNLGKKFWNDSVQNVAVWHLAAPRTLFTIQQRNQSLQGQQYISQQSSTMHESHLLQLPPEVKHGDVDGKTACR